MAKDKISEEELSNIVSEEIQQSIGYIDDKIKDERTVAQQYYKGEDYGNEVKGRSQVKTTEVRDAIEWIIPSLVRQFTGYDKAAVFSPAEPQDEQAAEQATDYVNYVINRDNNGFLIYTSALKDGLLSRLGVIKSYWDADEKWSLPELYEGLNDDEFTLMVMDENIRVVEHTEVEIDPIEGLTKEELESNLIDLAEDEALAPITKHDIKIRRRTQNGRIGIDNIPPEEFIVSRDAKFSPRTGTVEARLIGHRRKISILELIEAGYDQEKVEALPTAQDFIDQEADERLRDITDIGTNQSAATDETSREVWVTEAYLNADMDGDGHAELLKVTVGGYEGYGAILDFEEWDEIPFSVFSPILVPHTLYGLSIFNLIGPIQLIKSTLSRQIMDNLYQTNNPRILANVSQVYMNDLVDHKIGGVVRTRGDMNSAVPLNVPFTAGHSMTMMGYWDKAAENRTGVGPSSMGLNPEALQNTTATSTAIMNTAAQSKVEMIARMFAETAGKHLLKHVLHLAVKHETKERLIRLRNEWVPMKPSSWNTNMDVVVNIGIGTGSKEQQLMHLANIAQKQEVILTTLGAKNPLVNLKNYYNTLSQMVVNAGLKSPDNYFIDPSTASPEQQMQQPQQSPEMMLAQQNMQINQMKAEADIQLDREKWQAELELKKLELDAEIKLKSIKLGMSPGSSTNVRNPM